MVLSFSLYVAICYIWQLLCDRFPKKLLPKEILPRRTCPIKLPIPLLAMDLRRVFHLDIGKQK
ncbi:MAG: hypothetical protein V7K27_09065 [Nostoc sp.]|uniref:hypothetical protein n=1 Tax=Nostoc sp. TaxID=1180 RepID=UPI002FF4427C